MQRSLCERTWAEIDLDALEYNYRAFLACLPKDAALMGVLKANAYGNGTARVGRELEALGVRSFAVAALSEAAELREAGVTGSVLVLGYTPPMLAGELVRLGCAQTLLCHEYAAELSRQAVAAGVTVEVQLKLDTGMHRIGYRAEEEAACRQAAADAALPGLRVTGAFTHFACADLPGDEALRFTRLQSERFEEACRRIEAAGCPLPKRHVCNTGGITLVPEANGSCARLGAGLTGYSAVPGENPLGLRPVMSLRTVVAMVKPLFAGDSVGYGLTYTAAAQGSLATLPVGYADGYPPALAKRGWVLLHGKRAPIRGKICMDQLMVDTSEIPDVQMGDIVTLVGRDGEEEIDFRTLEALCGESYESLMTRLGRRIPLYYLRGGKRV